MKYSRGFYILKEDIGSEAKGMLVTLLSWVYIAFICLLFGTGVMHFLRNSVGQDKTTQVVTLTGSLIAGVVSITVCAEFFSIAGRIGWIFHIILLVLTGAAGCLGRKELLALWKKYRPVLFSWEGFFYLCFALLIAFFTSRGTFHTDTNIYHAQNIRLYEEYGLIRGMGNLQLHYAYNSAYLAFASAFSMHWLFGRSLHTTTGFLELILCIYAFFGLKSFPERKKHVADMMRVGILFYALVMLTGSMSPATDYATMLMVLYVITAWCENMEQKQSITDYAWLSVAAVFVVTMKFSACLLVLIALYPAVCLLKGKRWKDIAVYVGSGVLILTPFLIRNYLISGWLLYPFNGIDIFQAEWKVPEEYLLMDVAQIKVWGRCLYDITKIDLPIPEWIGSWWEGQARYEQMLVGGVMIGTVFLAVQMMHMRVTGQKIRWDMAALVAAVFANLAVWFLTAPFIRYGLAFLFAIPMIAVGNWLSEQKRGFYSILSGGMVFCIFMALSPYWDNYITDAGVFLKQNAAEPYYLLQKDYDMADNDILEINGNAIYVSSEGIVNSYHVFPSTCYEFMLERSTLMGDKIEDGFKAK